MYEESSGPAEQKYAHVLAQQQQEQGQQEQPDANQQHQTELNTQPQPQQQEQAVEQTQAKTNAPNYCLGSGYAFISGKNVKKNITGLGFEYRSSINNVQRSNFIFFNYYYVGNICLFKD